MKADPDAGHGAAGGRRRWLAGGALTAGLALAGLSTSTRLLAAGTPAAATPRLLLVFLRGGFDALSWLVPQGSGGAFYREVRPNIAIVERPALAGVASPAALALPGSADWGLHPAFERSLAPLVQAQQACFVPFAGSDDLTRSHFETQDSIELGQALGARRDTGSGFLNRLAAVIDDGVAPRGRRAIAFTDQLPLVLRGDVGIANLSLKTEPRAGDARMRAALTQIYAGHALAERLAESFEVRSAAARDLAPAAAEPAAAAAGLAGEQVSANRGAINAKGFELEARRIARLMRERYALGFVDVGGWDSHVGQGHGSGYLAQRFEELGRGLAAYADELGARAWRDTVVVVLSEFGRTARENGNRGTDHGHGSVYTVLGGGLQSGAAVRGEQQAVNAAGLHQNRDLPVRNEVRALLGGLMQRQFGLNPAELDAVFPGAVPRDLRLL